ncbi:hypothetical protein CI610_03020 [invertebrate metagenome]|uniref:Uncharacterized protein n=1 Tax=invertebrate metagenome TaxID=1711999 RepID=A0A2H9T4C2_9ZZZZ
MIFLHHITHCLPARLKRMLLLVMATALYLPWYTSSDMSYFSPALLTALYDGLSNGTDAIKRAGLIVGIAISIAIVMGLILPIRKQQRQPSAKKQPIHHSATTIHERKEPYC